MPKDGYYVAHSATLGKPSCGVAVLAGAVIGVEYGDRTCTYCGGEDCDCDQRREEADLAARQPTPTGDGDRHHVSCMFGHKYQFDGLKYTPVSVSPEFLKKRGDENFRDLEPGETIVQYADGSGLRLGNFAHN